MAKPTKTTPLGEAQAWFHRRLKRRKRVDCPCCGRRGEIYTRTLTAEVARGLQQIEEQHPKGWFRTKTARKWAIAKHWGLVKCQKRGVWKLTKAGRDFVRGKIEIRSHALIYAGNCLKLYGDMIDIRQALSSPGRSYGNR